MLNRLEDYSERDLTVALASPNWSQEEIDVKQFLNRSYSDKEVESITEYKP